MSDDNAFAESLFRHLKYAPAYPRHGFATVDEAKTWVARFVDWYNHEHLHASIALVTPDDRHHGRDIAILQKRRDTYALAWLRNPRRWTTKPRAWRRPETVTLNPERLLLTAVKGGLSSRLTGRQLPNESRYLDESAQHAAFSSAALAQRRVRSPAPENLTNVSKFRQ